MRSMLCGPSSSGKADLLSNMILDIYRGCVSRMYIWSPSINVGSTWRPVKDYIRDHIKPSGREKYYFDSHEPSELEQVIKTQEKVIDYQKQQKHKDLYQILVLVDGFVDDPSFTGKSQLLHLLYVRGRHYMMSTFTATQVYKAVSPVIRKKYDICLCTDSEIMLTYKQLLKKWVQRMALKHYCKYTMKQ